ncbi:MAG: HU family DNA-binding protein [Sideroxydans sp.]|nr:HU family DNA-binding protein [Sideroxydans sp.]MDD5056660.1 HU family DNA-binding protein [Sideroxydans sp.]
MSNTASKALLKDEIIGRVAEENNISKALSGKQLASIVKLIQQQLAKKGVFILPGIGKFSVVKRAARAGRNPRNGEPIRITARKVATFKAAKELRDAIA